MGPSTDDPRYAPPQAAVDDIAPPGAPLQLASRGARLGALVLDVVFLFIVYGAAAVVLPLGLAQRSDSIWSPQWASSLAGMVVFFAMNGWLLLKRGQTIGKAFLGLRITRPDGSAVSPGRLLGLRYALGSVIGIVPVLGWVWVLADSLLIFRPSRRCLHDSIADTIVVKAN